MKKSFLILFLLVFFSHKNLSAQEAVNIFPRSREVPKEVIYHESGKRYRLNEFKGNFVLLVFWSKKCAVCLKEFDDLNNFSNIVKNNGIKVVLVSPSTEWHSFGQTRRFMDRFGANDLDVYWDENGNLASALGVFSTPHNVLINKEGREIGRIRGGADWDKQEIIDYIYELKAKY
ncbi:MAG: TlpA disulfide reductase family protein [Alphaproteobacteria bacterium]|nr:TlpA disulfide reductase family protein [Alphaproteobacteria bacterium]